MEPSVIIRFFSKQTVFLTGATGFVGKILVEKLLRTCRDLDAIYILIRAKKGKSPEERLLHYTLKAVAWYYIYRMIRYVFVTCFL